MIISKRHAMRLAAGSALAGAWARGPAISLWLVHLHG
jgi:hypothetical protein